MQLLDIEPYLIEGDPVSVFFKDALKNDEFVVFTDTVENVLYNEVQNMMSSMDKKFKTIEVNSIPGNEDIYNMLKIISKGLNPPHLFFQQQYVSSGRALKMLYDNGGLEKRLRLDPIIIQ